jgi:hypothetical protein
MCFRFADFFRAGSIVPNGEQSDTDRPSKPHGQISRRVGELAAFQLFRQLLAILLERWWSATHLAEVSCHRPSVLRLVAEPGLRVRGSQQGASCGIASTTTFVKGQRVRFPVWAHRVQLYVAASLFWLMDLDLSLCRCFVRSDHPAAEQ